MKRLLLTHLFAGIFLSAHSQVYTTGFPFTGYHDIEPDTLLNYTVAPYTNETFSINLFSDSLNDIEFTARGAISSGGSDAYINVASLNPNVYMSWKRLDSVYVPGSSSWNITKIAKPHGTGDTINSLDVLWDNTTLYLTDHSGHSGGVKNVNDWIGGEKFLALKYQEGANLAYGWVRLECPDQDSCYVKNFSFTPLIAGIKEIEKENAVIYPNPIINNTFYLRNINMNAFDISELKLTDMFSREIKFTCEVQDNIIKINTDEISEGVYLLHYFSKNSFFATTLIKIKE